MGRCGAVRGQAGQVCACCGAVLGLELVLYRDFLSGLGPHPLCPCGAAESDLRDHVPPAAPPLGRRLLPQPLQRATSPNRGFLRHRPGPRSAASPPRAHMAIAPAATSRRCAPSSRTWPT